MIKLNSLKILKNSSIPEKATERERERERERVLFNFLATFAIGILNFVICSKTLQFCIFVQGNFSFMVLC